jgi:hypothetical protein
MPPTNPSFPLFWISFNIIEPTFPIKESKFLGSCIISPTDGIFALDSFIAPDNFFTRPPVALFILSKRKPLCCSTKLLA